MLWRCPACQIEIQHKAFEDAPRTGIVYRCHVCRLELSADAQAQRLTIAPLAPDRKDRDKT